MLDRGNCSFSTKTYYAQMAGANLALLANLDEKTSKKDIWIIDD